MLVYDKQFIIQYAQHVHSVEQKSIGLKFSKVPNRKWRAVQLPS